ncbi:DUF3953 domain-containing protein [Neobacillus drentensis]|uniref:DUF3953 domain-containing protein n=1 Tax=Neobacillus drentensis TaxID=220684 RepID=UPI0008248993|nr:DUF3953 domain-containing protein [Neobacillus drentensis]
MLKILRIILSIITIGLSGFSLITQNFEYTPYLMFSFGATMLVIGLIELQKNRREFWGYFGIVASLFVFYVAIKGFFLH